MSDEPSPDPIAKADSPPAEESPTETEAGGVKEEANEGDGSSEKVIGSSEKVIGSSAIRPIFLGNLLNNFSSEAVQKLFESPPSETEFASSSFTVDRVDLKRGYCFIFLKDASTQAIKEEMERYVTAINGMDIPGVSRALRAEFARGDGRVKRKEDERRKNIAPSETLFVVNFQENTTQREDLQMLFEPFGSLLRIDMKRNYAFVQFKTIDEARKAKEATDGGKLDQAVLTVEYVAQRRSREDGPRGRRDDYRRDMRRDGGYRGPPRYDDRRRYEDDRRRFEDGRRRLEDDRRHRGYDRRSRSRSPPRRNRSTSRDRFDGRERRNASPGYQQRDRSPPGRGYRQDGGRGYR